MSQSTEKDSDLTPPEIREQAMNTTRNLLPTKCEDKYQSAYQEFVTWKDSRSAKSWSENVLLAYFSELKEKVKWSRFSMLKSTIRINNNIDISSYSKLIAFLKKESVGFQSKKSKVLTSDEVSKFLKEAPNQQYLATKVALIFGITGALRKGELCEITTSNIEDCGSHLLITIPKTKTHIQRKFTVDGEFYYNLFKSYQTLRPKNTESNRFFLNYQNGKCTNQVIGINKFGAMPKMIAQYLNLPDDNLYTGHSFRRTSATILANSGADILTLKRHGGWKSTKVAESYIEDSVHQKMKVCNQITSELDINQCTKRSGSKTVDAENTPAKQSKIESTTIPGASTSNDNNNEVLTATKETSTATIIYNFNNCSNFTVNLQ